MDMRCVQTFNGRLCVREAPAFDSDFAAAGFVELRTSSL
jgi:hypothetical protein